ncbi:MAG: hypothetical protein WC026_16700 [Hyphomicrobium sp.]|uniref:hypothetical protein n=1 Tax=Hyphomicrobium sp. TaxID=82 RepID=UPI00356A235B
MTLKEAIEKATERAHARRGAYMTPLSTKEIVETALASLEANGFVVVPKEATGEMNQLGMAAIADAMEEGFMLTPGEVFTKMLAARPKIGGEG